MGLLAVEGLLPAPSLDLAGCCRCCLPCRVQVVLISDLEMASVQFLLGLLGLFLSEETLAEGWGLEESPFDFPWCWRIAQSSFSSCHKGRGELMSHQLRHVLNGEMGVVEKVNQ